MKKPRLRGFSFLAEGREGAARTVVVRLRPQLSPAESANEGQAPAGSERRHALRLVSQQASAVQVLGVSALLELMPLWYTSRRRVLRPACLPAEPYSPGAASLPDNFAKLS